MVNCPCMEKCCVKKKKKKSLNSCSGVIVMSFHCEKEVHFSILYVLIIEITYFKRIYLTAKGM